MSSIVTHSGTAHRDDVLACAMLTFACDVRHIMRVPNVTRELVQKIKPEFIVDIGGKYDVDHGSPRWMDHHQFDREHPTSAFQMSVEFICRLKRVPDVRNYFFRPGGIVDQITTLDHLGPAAYAEKFGIDLRKGGCTFPGPIETAIIVGFEQGTVGVSVLRAIGQTIWDNALEVSGHVAEIRKICHIEGDVLFVPGMKEFTPEATRLIRDELLAKKQTVNAMVIKDNRGAGLTLYRFDDSPLYDFAKLEREHSVNFAHRGGFIAKTKSYDLAEARRLLRIARM